VWREVPARLLAALKSYEAEWRKTLIKYLKRSMRGGKGGCEFLIGRGMPCLQGNPLRDSGLRDSLEGMS